ncbi:hypothetical protein SCLCIDRAFT_647830 [Scleroderma citrinum Foug A]|uniref:Uncharacterized protein n=1 Tax=Scleroderma citrinum Foug A TaxID=1036808 RepID=A0A0C3E7E3_9AGAM|nr:hypothetical protein SCLCIDRAFT_647830 [Scleroderma citrinum Foug A]
MWVRALRTRSILRVQYMELDYYRSTCFSLHLPQRKRKVSCIKNHKVTPTGNASPSFEHPRLQSPRKYICLCEGPGSLAHEFSTDVSYRSGFPLAVHFDPVCSLIQGNRTA